MHHVRFNIEMGRVLLVAGGFWDGSELSEFMAKIKQAFGQLSRANRPVSVLADLRTLQPQSQQVFGDPGFLATSAMINIERHAVVTGSALLRLQFRRFFDGIPTEFFDDRGAAIGWLGWNAHDKLLAEFPE